MRAQLVVSGSVALSALGAVLLAAACDSPSTLQPGENPAFTRSVHAHTAQDELLKTVRQATARFHSPSDALRAGYQPTDHCVEITGLGGMGYHWVNPGLVDPRFDPLEPEVVLYASGPGGNLRLVAVEYIVIDTGQGRPSFAGHPFDIGGTPIPASHWSLHVWLYEENPDGIFSPFNPNVSCP